MNIFSIIFLVVSFGSMIGAFILEGGSPTMLAAGSAAIIVFGGTIGSVGLGSSPKKLKNIPAMLRLISTLYGVGSANLIFLPMASRLKDLNNEEIKEKELIVEAVLLIQEGANPNILAEK